MWAGKAEEKKSALQRSPQVRKWCSIQVAPAFCDGCFRVADSPGMVLQREQHTNAARRPPVMKEKPSSRRRRSSTKSVLRLPDLEHAKAAVLNSLNSTDAKRGNRQAIDFIRRLLLEHAQQDVQAEPHHHAGDDEHQDL
jgi:hypothetical protein